MLTSYLSPLKFNFPSFISLITFINMILRTLVFSYNTRATAKANAAGAEGKGEGEGGT